MDEDNEKVVEPTPRHRRHLLRLHRNLGHPGNKEFGRALRHAGVRRELVRWATRSLRCPLCDERKRPLVPRPGMLPRTMRFNQVIGADLLEAKYSDKTLTVLSVV